MADEKDNAVRIEDVDGRVDLLERDLRQVAEAATRDARFVRRVMTTAAGVALAGVTTAIAMIYGAGERAAETKAQRDEMSQRIQHVQDGLTDLRGQVNLLLKRDLRENLP